MNFFNTVITKLTKLQTTFKSLYVAKSIGPWKYELNQVSIPFFKNSVKPCVNHPKKLIGTKYQMPAITVDNVILCEELGQLHCLRIQRGPATLPVEFQKTWAFPGGFIDYGKETAFDAVKRETLEETGLDVSNPIEAFTMSHPDRDPRQHCVSIVYVSFVDSKIPVNELCPIDKEEVPSLDWIPIDSSEDQFPFPFDHDEILKRVVGNLETYKLIHLASSR